MRSIITAMALLALTLFNTTNAAAQLEPRIEPRLVVPDAFNYIAGTQTFSPAYQFTNEPKLIETAKAILAMGSNTIKFGMDRGRRAQDGGTTATVKTLADLAVVEPTYRQVLEMPFAHYLIWADGLATRGLGSFIGERAKISEPLEYREIYDFTRHLLTRYNGTGKTFYLGHWEGDWLLLGGTANPKAAPAPERIEAMIKWLATRQRAVDDARHDTPHAGVAVWHYTEVNLVRKAMAGGRTLTNDVLPRVNVDYVSYSAYDSLKKEDLRGNLTGALDYIESKLPRKEGVPGRRVFIGEYGFPSCFNTPEEQAEYSRQVLRAGIEWGCPFVLYWELYNNEVDKDGKQRGFWMIDDKGAKQPVYFLHQRFYELARRFVADYRKAHGRAPDGAEFRKAALGFLIN